MRSGLIGGTNFEIPNQKVGNGIKIGPPWYRFETIWSNFETICRNFGAICRNFGAWQSQLQEFGFQNPKPQFGKEI
ncbi:hypothetical protein LCGC14_1291100 [marine sediment metagenome]|uniref:Uncharacterized protein n=1 Tax=marine sediment metagenome TaxID=412755 RepID=A0A0F9N8U2_9ZZZZ